MQNVLACRAQRRTKPAKLHSQFGRDRRAQLKLIAFQRPAIDNQGGLGYRSFPNEGIRHETTFLAGIGDGVRAVGPCVAGALVEDTEKTKNHEVERIVSTVREECQAMDHLDVLCNRIGPRLTGSDNLTNACEWVRDRFASFGIDNARLEAWGEFPVGFNRGPWFGRVIQPEPKVLEFKTEAWTAGTKGAVRGKAVLRRPTRKSSTLLRRRERLPEHGWSSRNRGALARDRPRHFAARFAKSWKTPGPPGSCPRHPAISW